MKQIQINNPLQEAVTKAVYEKSDPSSGEKKLSFAINLSKALKAIFDSGCWDLLNVGFIYSGEHEVMLVFDQPHGERSYYVVSNAYFDVDDFIETATGTWRDAEDIVDRG